VTRQEAAAVVAMLKLWWPHSDLTASGISATVDGWHEALGSFGAEEVERALRQLRDTGREHAPPLGVVVAAVRRAQQPPPPSFDDVQAYLSRNVSLLPYGGDDRNTASAVEALTAAGAHEAVCRWVAEVGLYTARMTPDGSLYPLDPGQSADRRDKARSYERRTIPDWEADPTPGLALQRVRERHGVLARAEGLRRLTPEAGIPTRADVERATEVAKREGLLEEGEDGPSVESTREAFERFRERLATRRAQQQAEQAAADERRRQDYAKQQAAARELEAQRRRVDESGGAA
jgi:hypothetical protein